MALTLFLAGILTILLPCILPLLPIVLGVSVAGRSRMRPLWIILGMVVSFVASTVLLLVLLREFAELGDVIRLSTYYLLFLFGVAFVTENRMLQLVGAIVGAPIFFDGFLAIAIAETLGVAAMELGGRIASKMQTFGTTVQGKARAEFGSESGLSAFIIGLTLGLVWVPCAGPALAFALTLVREEPGLRAVFLLSSYALGAALPLLLVGYGGQWALRSARSLSRVSGIIKQCAGVLLILTALALQYHIFERIQVWALEHTPLGAFEQRLEERLFPKETSSPSSMDLPKIARAPEFQGLGPWHNSDPFTLQSLRGPSDPATGRAGKVVLVDFWTYSCINCIRTLPHMERYWQSYKDTGKFVLIGIHSPEFVFEKSEQNVADAIARHRLTYPVAQDNDFLTWRAFANRYWPAKYLIDAEGYIRYTHFGEGAYEETDEAIRTLLEEIGVSMEGQAEGTGGTDGTDGIEGTQVRRELTPEIYLGVRSWPALGNAEGDPSEEVITYSAPSELRLHKYYLIGDWQLQNSEHQVLRSETGEIRLRFLGGEVNLVLGVEGKPVTADVFIDGNNVKTFTIDRHDLYPLFKGEYGEHELQLKFTGKGVQGFAFTFGS